MQNAVNIAQESQYRTDIDHKKDLFYLTFGDGEEEQDPQPVRPPTAVPVAASVSALRSCVG